MTSQTAFRKIIQPKTILKNQNLIKLSLLNNLLLNNLLNGLKHNRNRNNLNLK